MTIHIGSLRIVIQITKVERFPVKIDKLQTLREAQEIKSSEYFQQLKAQAQVLRAERAQ